MIGILLSCVLLSLLILWKTYNNRKRGCLPPLAGGALPIVGHTWIGFVKRERLYEVVLEKLSGSLMQRDGEIVYLQVGTWKLYMCMDPDDGYLLSNSCLEKDSILYKFVNPVFGGANGLINADVPTWKIHRKLLNPTFNQSVLDSYLIEFNAQSRQLVTLLTQEVGKGYFDQLVYVKRTVSYVVCATILGINADDNTDLIEECAEAAEILTSCVVERIRNFYYHSDFLFNLSNLKKKQDAGVKILHSFLCKAISHKIAKISRQEEMETDAPAPQFKSFLDLLFEVGKDGALSDSDIQQEANTILGAAFDTTFHALGMMLLVIGSYPEVQQKILDELQAVFKGSTRDVERHDMSQMKYLEAVIKETMRLYPVVLMVGRTVDKDLKLKKYTLPAGSRCYISIYHMGRHRSWGADAGLFRPERWLDGSLPTNTKAYAVFGLGRRNCIGSNYAMMLMKTVLCHVVRRYRISGDVSRLVQNFDVVVTPVSGHHISIEERDE